MRISSKGCYAIAALTEMALDDEDSPIAVAGLAARLKISKVYLEQVFSILKRSGLINSIKGAQGGYTLRNSPANVTLYDILSAFELTLFEGAGKSLENIPTESGLLISKLVLEPLDEAVSTVLKSITLADLADESRKQQENGNMYYI